LNSSVYSDAVFNFLLHCRKIETMPKSSGAVHYVSRLRSILVLWDASLGVGSYVVSTLSTGLFFA
jgi:hypothetical protein